MQYGGIRINAADTAKPANALFYCITSLLCGVSLIPYNFNFAELGHGIRIYIPTGKVGRTPGGGGGAFTTLKLKRALGRQKGRFLPKNYAKMR